MESEVNGSSIKTPSLFSVTVNVVWPASEKHSRRICKKKKIFLNSDGASQIVFYLNTFLRERWGKLGESFSSYQIDPQSTQAWRLCIERKKFYQSERNDN